MSFLPWVNVSSSRCQAVRFDPGTGKLQIQFHKGRHTVYTYDGCTPETFQSLLDAPSKGKWIEQHVVKAGWAYSSKR